MSIATAITNAQNKIAACYTAISGKGGTLPATQDLANMPTSINSISGGVTVNSLSVTENGTYTAPEGTAYSPVTVNVSGGGGIGIYGTPFGDPIDWDKIAAHSSLLNYQVSTSGRKFYRHPSGMGTVMSMNDGTDRNILVLDAQYRTNNKVYYADSRTNLNSSGDPLDLCTNTGYFSGSEIELPCTGFSDSTLNTSYSNICNQDTKTSKYNTDKLIAFNATNAQAASYCRSITVNGTGCDLPNINTAIRVYCEMVMLDSLDPTISSYPDYSLSSWSFNGHDSCRVSSWYGKYSTYYDALTLLSTGRAGYLSLNSNRGVFPILEL